MLECILVIRNIIIVVVRIGEEVIVHRKNVFTAQVGRGQAHFFRVTYFQYLLRVVIQILTDFITEICIRVPVTDHFDRVVDTNGPVVGGHNYFITFVGDTFEQLQSGGMLEPGTGQAAVSRFALRQFTDHFHFRTGMRQHIHEVEDNDIQLVMCQRRDHIQ